MRETTALGAAYAAGLSCGFYEDLDDLTANWSVETVWTPKIEATRREHLYSQWKKAVTRSFNWLEPQKGFKDGEVTDQPR